MTGLIEANRIVEAYQRVIQAVDEATGKATERDRTGGIEKWRIGECVNG